MINKINISKNKKSPDSYRDSFIHNHLVIIFYRQINEVTLKTG